METTVTIEFASNIEEHLRALEHQLKHIHDVHVDMIEPKDHSAPTLIAIGLHKGGERAKNAAHNVAQVLHDFLHSDTGVQGQRSIFLVTVEGERVDIEPLSVAEIESIIFVAEEEEP